MVTQGDHLGIGPELVVRALAGDAATGCDVVVLGDPALLAGTADALSLPVPDVVGPPAGKGGAHVTLWALEEAVRLASAGEADAIVTAPITKSALTEIGFSFPGHTEFLGARLGTDAPTMMLAGDGLRVALVTTHLPLRAVPDAVTTAAVERAVRRTHVGLRRWFGVDAPRIAVLGLNPHAGEDGLFGREDEDVIAPAVAACREDGIDAQGPLPGDGSFAPRMRERWDAYVAMYHDQGLAPLKTLCGGGAVNLTLGLPVLRTSPDHGSARDIAGRGCAEPGSMIAALSLAARAARAPRTPITF